VRVSPRRTIEVYDQLEFRWLEHRSFCRAISAIKAAKTLGITIPDKLLTLADEVIK
jgi:hypothetical protein